MSKAKPKALDEFLKETLSKLKEENLFRSTEDKIAKDGELVFSSNDYLGFNTGSTGSRLTNGTHEIHEELERMVAKWKGTEAAACFSSGYMANLGTISALLGLRDVAYSDALNHACILDGIRLSKSNKFLYHHNDMEHLENLLEKTRSRYSKALILTDSIFSMEGDKARLEKLVELAKKYNASVYLDEAHGTGVLGETGAGLAEELGLSKEVDIQMGTFSKALSSDGAYVAGSQELIDFIKNKCRTFIYTTAPAPDTIKTTIKNLKECIKNKSLRENLRKNIKLLRDGLDKIGIKYGNEETPIFAIYVGDVDATVNAAKKLREQGLIAHAIRPPTVSTPRLRVTVSSVHTPKEIDNLLELLQKL